MLRSLLFLLLLLAFFGSRAANTQRDTLVHFASDEYELTAGSIALLDAFLANTDPQADVEFTIAGHTDSDASLGYNEQLALRRSEAVRSYLLDHGSPEDLITLCAFGERKAIASNNDEEGQAANRRVQLTCTVNHWQTTADLQARLREGSEQTFNIDPNSELTITTAAGARLQLPALALLDADGRPVKGSVQLNVTDALDLDVILGHALSTRSGDQLIETAGMLKIEAVGSDGAALSLDPSKPITVTLPGTEQKDGMQLFVSQDGSDWNTPPASTTFSWAISENIRVSTDPPVLQWPAMKKLVYHAPKNAPRKPAEPIHPKEPNAPRRESFNSTYRWWRFVSRETVRNNDERRYDAAMDKHALVLEKHARRVDQYELECAAYPQALEDFAARSAEWECTKEDHHDQWKREVWQPAFETYQRQREAVRPRNDSIMAAWRLRNDSLTAEWRKEREQYNDAYAARLDSLGNAATTNNLMGYVLTTSRLGWINCDRFMDEPGPRTILAIADPDASEEQVYVVFTRIKSMLQLEHTEGNSYRYENMPRNQPAVVFAYKVENGKPMLCHQPVDHTKKMKLDFKPSSFAEIRKVLRELNGTDA
ncbi:MAG: OmpA family protein [Flavobacteriales bacterium]